MKQTNTIYLYEDGFLNLLNLISVLIQHKIKPLNIQNSNYQASLLDEVIQLKIKNEQNLVKNIKERMGINFIKALYYIYLSEERNKELIIYYVYLNSFKYHQNIMNIRNLNCVNQALKTIKYVRREAHRMKGFLRFQELENKVLYAEMEPTNNIIEILSIHFKERLKNEYWIIKDKRRNIVSLYDKHDYYLLDGDALQINTSNKNQNYEELWQTFYKTIGIKERKNDRCRMNFMPKKYWKYLIEMSDEK